jgi:hypothetical protein
VNNTPWRSIVSASSRLRKVVIGGSSSRMPVDRQRQQSIEKGRDRRQLVADAGLVHQAEAGGAFEELERATFDLTADDQQVELAQRVARVGAFEIVLGSEEALSAGLALAACDRPEGVEPAGDGRQEALLGLHVGRDRTKQRRLRPVGAVGAAKALNGGVSFPARFEEIVDAKALVPRGEVSVVAAPGSPGVAEHQDALGIIHEGGGLGEVG